MLRIEIRRLFEINDNQEIIDTRDKQRVFDAANKGNLLVTGGVGFGKSTICFLLAEHLRQDNHVVHITPVTCTLAELYNACILSVSEVKRLPSRLEDARNQAKECFEYHQSQKNIFVLVNSAHDLSSQVLSEFLLFQEEIKNLRIILFSLENNFLHFGFNHVELKGLSSDEFSTYMQLISKKSLGKIPVDMPYITPNGSCGYLDVLEQCLKCYGDNNYNDNR